MSSPPSPKHAHSAVALFKPQLFPQAKAWHVKSLLEYEDKSLLLFLL